MSFQINLRSLDFCRLVLHKSSILMSSESICLISWDIWVFDVCCVVCVRECVCIPGVGRCCPPLPPCLSARISTQTEEQPGPLADTYDPLYWIPVSHTSTYRANMVEDEKVCLLLLRTMQRTGAKWEIVLQFWFCKLTLFKITKNTLGY